MSPNIEPVVGQQDEVKIRHIGPIAVIAPGSSRGQYSLLNRSDLVARTLPVANVPASPDFVSGYWTLRLDDAGELELVWPNSTSSDGPPWRSRFDPTGHLEWLEIYFNGELDATGVIDQTTPSGQSVTVHADDGLWLTKKAYVRDWTTTQAPRDIIDRGTHLWLPLVADQFAAGETLIWTANGSLFGGGGIGIGPSGGLVVTAPPDTGGGPPTGSQVWASQKVYPSTASGVYVAQTTTQPNTSANGALMVVTESDGTIWSLGCALHTDGTIHARFFGEFASTSTNDTVIASATSYALFLESDGEWVFGFVNGQMIGCYRRPSATTSSIEIDLYASLYDSGAAQSVVYASALVNVLQPFLMRGADKGDYVLPGDATSYPSGGLSARYFDDDDLASLSSTEYLLKALNPTRTQAYGGSTPAEYADQQDSVINGQAAPAGGSSSAANWSCVWFGSVYLKLSAGDYQFQIVLPGDDPYYSFRLWIGDTQWGHQIIDEWPPSSGTITVTLSSASLAGFLPNGGGSIVRDGWYPIKFEYAVGNTAGTAPVLQFHLPSGLAYYDPGGTVLESSEGWITVPPTSLSPLGCIDQRYQGIAHFDLIQQTLQSTGLHATVEPKQLESGLFPGVFAPRIREGHDTDIVLRPDTSPRSDGEGILNYSQTTDSTDFGSSIQGNGASTQSGTTGQLQAMVYDAAAMLDSLFDAQIWADQSDASLPQLLQALLNSTLALSLEPWQSLSADPTGRPRLAFTWPLPGEIQAMRWRPGDGVRIDAPIINVNDLTPRQMLVFTRNIAPFGQQSSQATFANRPKNVARTFSQLLFTLTRLQRNYQRPR